MRIRRSPSQLLNAKGMSAAAKGAKPATEATRTANRVWFKWLDFSDESEKENALRGLIEAPEDVVIYADDGTVAWNVEDFAFVKDTEARTR